MLGHLRIGLVAGIAIAALWVMPGVASADDAAFKQMQQEMQQLRAEVAELRAAKDQTWLNERRAEEVKALISEVLADADTRASLLDASILGGHDGKNFFLKSADGNFKMKIKAQAQVRYIANFANNGDLASGDIDEDLGGFQIRRTKLKLGGHAWDPAMFWKLTLASTRDHNEVYLEELLIGYKVNDKLKIAAGRTKAPFMREELTSSSKQLTVERSLVNEAFTAGFVEGVVAMYQPHENVKLAFALTDGIGSGEETVGAGGAGADWNAADVDVALTARADVKLAGEWKQMKDTSAWAGEDMALFLGAAVHYQKTETGLNAANMADDLFAWTIDGSLEINGLGIYAAVVGLHTNAPENSGAAPNFVFASGNPEDLNFYGFVVQAGYMVIPDKLEPFIRYEMLSIDNQVFTGSPAQTEDNPSLLTVGLNYYIKKHNVKFTVDVVHAFDSLGGAGTAFGVSDGLGLRADEPDQDGQTALRAQAQLLF